MVSCADLLLGSSSSMSARWAWLVVGLVSGVADAKPPKCKTAAKCTELGVQYQDGDGVVRSIKIATVLYERACKGGDYWGCKNLANLSRQQACGGASKQDCDDFTGDVELRERALSLATNACDSGAGKACVFAAGVYRRGGVVPKDVGKENELYVAAAKSFEAGCAAASYEDCNELGKLFTVGAGVSEDVGKAVEYFQKACDGGYAFGCVNLGGYRERRNPTLAAAAYKKGCAQQLALACEELQRMCAKRRYSACP